MAEIETFTSIRNVFRRKIEPGEIRIEFALFAAVVAFGWMAVIAWIVGTVGPILDELF